MSARHSEELEESGRGDRVCHPPRSVENGEAPAPFGRTFLRLRRVSGPFLGKCIGQTIGFGIRSVGPRSGSDLRLTGWQLSPLRPSRVPHGLLALALADWSPPPMSVRAKLVAHYTFHWPTGRPHTSAARRSRSRIQYAWRLLAQACCRVGIDEFPLRRRIGSCSQAPTGSHPHLHDRSTASLPNLGRSQCVSQCSRFSASHVGVNGRHDRAVLGVAEERRSKIFIICRARN